MKMLTAVRVPYVYVFYLTAVLAYTSEDMAALQRELLHNYNPLVRPIHNQSKAIQIGLSLSLMFIHALDEREQELKVSGWIHLEWHDDFLRWNESDYEGIKSIILPPTDVWRPDIAVSNSLERMTKLAQGDYLVRVKSDGFVEWALGDVFRTQCTVDITYYPFDVQSCNITVGTWMYAVNEVNFHALDNVSLSHYKDSGEWDISATGIHSVRKSYDCCPDEDTVAVTVTLRISRRKSFYILTVIIPVLMFSFLNVVDFLLPPNSGEKMSLSVTVFLSFALYMSLVNESMPRTSLTLSILGIYMTTVMGLGAASVVLSSIVIMVHHKEREEDDSRHQREPQTQQQTADVPRVVLPPGSRRNPKYIITESDSQGFVVEKLSESEMTSETNGIRDGILNGKPTANKLASRCDRIFLWLSLAFSIISAIVVLVILLNQ